MRLLKVELLLDLNEIVEPSDINAVISAVFENNSHLAKLMICDSRLVEQENKKKHEWEFYMNGSFCKKCGVAIGSGVECI